MTPQEQLCKLIELDRKELSLRAALSQVRHDLKELGRALMDAEAVDENSIFFYQDRAYYLEADFEGFSGISITSVRDLGAGQ